jgi:hypothetical protein
MTETQEQERCFVLTGRIVGMDDAAWADCTCGWHYEGTLVQSREAAERHMKGDEYAG